MKLERILIAVTRIEPMVRFYDAVFASDLAPIESTPLWGGQLAGLRLVLCPAEIAAITATENRHQLRFEVDSLEATLDRVRSAGGEVLTDRWEKDNQRGQAFRDPDGNSIELLETRTAVVP